MVVLDLTIVNVALPTIQQELGLDRGAVQWVVIGYGLLFGGFLLVGGGIGDLFGRRRVLVAGMAIFSLASLAAGLAESSTLLIAARAIQGFGAALISPSALAILAASFAEGKERNTALAIFGAAGGASASVGVLTSGLLTDGPGWPFIFFLNVPVGVVLVVLALRYLPVDVVGKTARKFNLTNAIAITGGLVSLVYGLNKGVDAGWGSPSTLIWFAAAAVLIGAFVRTELRSRAPLVPGAVFKNRASTSAIVSAFFAFGAFYAFIFVMTLLLQQQLHYSATQTGLAWLVTSVTAFVVAGITGSKLVVKFGVKRLLLIGLSLLALSLLWLVRIPAQASFLIDVVPTLLLSGVGVGLIGPSVQIGALSGVKPELFGLVSGVVETMRELGGVVTIAVASTVLAGSTLQRFHTAFLVTVGTAVLGALWLALSSLGRRQVAVRARPVLEAAASSV
jgi:EmrB/QacA subfamily drug resistance transporter